MTLALLQLMTASALRTPRLFAEPVTSSTYDTALEGLTPGERYEALALSVLTQGKVQEALELVAEEPLGLTGRVGRALIDEASKQRDRALMRSVCLRKQFTAYGSRPSQPPNARFAKGEIFVSDERGRELSAAIAAIGSAGTALAMSGYDAVAGLDPTAPDLALVGMAAATGLDIWKNQGQLTGFVTSGLSRLVVDDPRREAECEAAALLAGYTLGLPAFPFKPTAFEALQLLTEDADADAVLAWLCAPLAAESNKHRKLVVADPRQPEAALQLAKDRGYIVDDTEDDLRLRWALKQARTILTNNAQLHLRLSDFFESKAVSPGDCVGLIEGWA